MEPEVSIPHPEAPATWPSPEPEQSRPCFPSHVLKIHFNIILSTPGSSRWSLSIRSSHQNPVFTSLVPHTFHTHLILLDLITWIIFGERYRSLSCSVSMPCYFDPLKPEYLPHRRLLEHLQPMFLPQCEQPSFTPIQNKRQNYSSVCLDLFIFG